MVCSRRHPQFNILLSLALASYLNAPGANVTLICNYLIAFGSGIRLILLSFVRWYLAKICFVLNGETSSPGHNSSRGLALLGPSLWGIYHNA